MAITVLRSGATANRWTFEDRARLEPRDDGGAWAATDVTLTFSISAAGGGTTQVLVKIPSDEFASLAQAMMHVDAPSAIKAFGAALVKGPAIDPEDEVGG